MFFFNLLGLVLLGFEVGGFDGLWFGSDVVLLHSAFEGCWGCMVGN